MYGEADLDIGTTGCGFSQSREFVCKRCSCGLFNDSARSGTNLISLWGKMARSQQWQSIPTRLSFERFQQFVLPHLTVGSRGPAPKLTLHTVFNYILRLLYLGCQWKELPIERDQEGRAEIHYTRIYSAFRKWQADGCFDAVFAGSVPKLHQADFLDATVIHGDGTTTAAKKGGDKIGFSGHKKVKGDKIVAFCDRRCNVIAPFVSAPGNRNESPLLREALPLVTRIAMRFHDASNCAPIPHVGSTTKSRFNAQNISKSPWLTLPSRKFAFSIDFQPAETKNPQPVGRLPPIFALNETLHSAPLSGIILTDQCVSTQAGPQPVINCYCFQRPKKRRAIDCRQQFRRGSIVVDWGAPTQSPRKGRQ